MELTFAQKARLEASEAQSKARAARREADKLEAEADEALRKAEDYEELMDIIAIGEAKGYTGTDEEYLSMLDNRPIWRLRYQVDNLPPLV